MKTIEDFRKPSGRLDRQALQTSGEFKTGDKHPFVLGVFYLRQTRGKQQWADIEGLERFKQSIDNYWRREDVRIRQRETWKRYYRTDKGKRASERSSTKYTQSDKGKKTRQLYRETDAFKSRVANFRNSEKGKALSNYHTSKRRARIKRASTKLTFAEEQLIKQYYEHSTRLKNKLGIEFHVDHIVPLSLGGLHHPSNLQVVPARWNVRKNNTNTNLWLPNGL
jgi:hypothetical protein